MIKAHKTIIAGNLMVKLNLTQQRLLLCKFYYIFCYKNLLWVWEQPDSLDSLRDSEISSNLWRWRGGSCTIIMNIKWIFAVHLSFHACHPFHLGSYDMCSTLYIHVLEHENAIMSTGLSELQSRVVWEEDWGPCSQAFHGIQSETTPNDSLPLYSV